MPTCQCVCEVMNDAISYNMRKMHLYACMSSVHVNAMQLSDKIICILSEYHFTQSSQSLSPPNRSALALSRYLRSLGVCTDSGGAPSAQAL